MKIEHFAQQHAKTLQAIAEQPAHEVEYTIHDAMVTIHVRYLLNSLYDKHNSPTYENATYLDLYLYHQVNIKQQLP